MNIEKLKSFSKKIRKELTIYKLVLKDKRTPLISKILLGAAIGYFLLPFDLIPDFVPGIGQLDDIIIVPLLVYLAIRLIPEQIIRECKALLNQTTITNN